MYRLEWIEELKSRGRTAATSGRVSPVVLSLGFTSLLTDISAEMVNSVLPVYLVLHLRLSPVQFGAIDGLYNGFAVALLSLVAGHLADRSSRQKQLALAGYVLSTVCKLLLLAVGATWAGLMLVTGLDRAGKGVRTAPRDALISLNTPEPYFANAFAVHRAMDACGSLLGPIVAFVLLARLPGAFDAVWVASFVFGVLGVAVLWLFVPAAERSAQDPPAQSVTLPAPVSWRSPRFMMLAVCGGLLALTTISDGFLYLMMQQKSSAAAGFFPLFYVLTAGSYMLFSIPAGRIADSYGRRTVFIAGYVLLAALYGALLSLTSISMALLIGSLALLGMYYACTEGVLMAMVSAIVPARRRTTGIAVVATAIGCGKLVSSILFGWLWQSFGLQTAVLAFMVALAAAISITALRLEHAR